MKKDREIESRLIKSVMIYFTIDGLAKVCVPDNEIIIVPIAVILIGVILTLKIFD
jgi:hypothetical protein